ncbi:hypothetical protein J2Z76_000969 [Sedimentibacter acidaminivorans]|uniref:Uncharacterized protein n=1 Tax=Sedimentibacter acidaminivorans TaxID=913099 RepID=A0ABS4GBR9_9FIRM|nr:DUF6762 family protein [Sedimentibacter acidaminivorans]MBP1925112.1 hypothetical protein [Sedimentibacter acidaminivorans]
MDNYNNLILMKKEKETGFLVETIGSYEITKYIEYIDKIYAMEDGDVYYIYLTLTTDEIEEDWKYQGVFDLYNEEVFSDRICEIEELPGYYNPKWIVKIEYSINNEKMQQLLNELLDIHVSELKRIIPLINKEEYINENE